MEQPDPTAIGNLLLRHKDIRASLREAELRYDAVKRQLAELSKMVNNHKTTIHVTADGFASGYDKTIVPFDALESLRSVTADLHDANEERLRIETCMHELGLGEYVMAIRPDET